MVKGPSEEVIAYIANEALQLSSNLADVRPANELSENTNSRDRFVFLC